MSTENRVQYLLQVLDKIGAPLMAAIIEGAQEENAPIQDAQIMASLLGKTVQASIDLGQVMDINPVQAMDDSLRVALAALSGPLVAGQYKKHRQIPDDQTLKRTIGALQAVLAFSDNFTPSTESAARLQTLEAKGQPVDAVQAQIQYIQAFIPVVEAIAEFSFGQGEQKLMTELTGRLVKKSIELREIIFPLLADESTQKRAELGLLKAIALIYSTAHRAETEKVVKAGDSARAEAISIESVWQKFELRTAMLEILVRHLLPVAAHSQLQNSQTEPVNTEKQLISEIQPAQKQESPPQPSAAAANPMAMFSKPKPQNDIDQSPKESSIAAASQAPIPSSTPPAQDPLPSSQTAEESESDEQGKSGSGGNPMSFFKKSE